MASPADPLPLVDYAPALRLALLALVAALLPLSWWWLRQRGSERRARLAALTALTLFLTFDLIVFGAFTRLTDSGLGCPDWPGCYGQASPLGAAPEIHAAQTALPGGPVSFGKAWIEMIHRYLAMTVGVLILVMAAVAWFDRWRGEGAAGLSPAWPTLTLAWVIVQGLFGRTTVTLKLFPAVVTLHLLGGLILLVLLAAQHARLRPRPMSLAAPARRALVLAAALLAAQVALGGWVSSNYAVLACTDFPRCNGHWWPPMDFGSAFTLLRPLGGAADGGFVTQAALVAMHMAHRLFALLATGALLWLAFALRREGSPASRRFAVALFTVTSMQVLSGLGNVVLGWPLAAALIHSAGAAALVLLLALLCLRARSASPVERAAAAKPVPA